MRIRLDAADVLLIGYPLLVLASFELIPDIAIPVFLTGAIIGVPLYLYPGHGEQIDQPPSRTSRLEWFKLFLAGVLFAWPYIIARFVGWRERKR